MVVKKGQPGWWGNRKPAMLNAPLLSHVVDRDGNMMNMVRWPSRKFPTKKRYGILEKWTHAHRPLFGGQGWTHWYRTAGDRDNALSALRKERWAHKKSFQPVER